MEDSIKNPPQQIPLVLVQAKRAYTLWHRHIQNLRQIDRDTIGNRIDDIFLSLLQLIFKACFAYDKFEKLSLVSQAVGMCDLLKFILQISWEQKILNHKQYGEQILLLDEVGRMLGGWKRSLADKTPTKNNGGRK